MKKIVSLAIILNLMFVLSSCVVGEKSVLNRENWDDEYLADTRIERVFTAIKNKNNMYNIF